MARTLSATLEAQQKYGLITLPYLCARITRKWGNVIRYDFESLYSGAEHDGPHAAVMPSDGSLIRLRVTEVGDSRKLYYQRVVNPGPGSTYSSWTYLSIYNVLEVAACSYGSDVAQFYVNTSRAIYYRESSDDGASWGSWTLIGYTPTVSFNGSDATYKPNGDLFFAIFDQETLYLYPRESDVWGAAHTNSNDLDTANGISLYYDTDFNFVATKAGEVGPPEVNAGVCVCRFTDPGEAWTAWDNIIVRSPTEPFTYDSPCARRPDTTRLYFMEHHTQAEETHYIFYSHMPPSAVFSDNAWLEPVPLNIQSEYGVAFNAHGSYVWLSNANRVFRALATDEELDLTSRILEVDSRNYPDIFKGSLKVIIDNTGGWYDAFNRLGQQLEVGIGYKTSEGYEYSLVPFCWITNFKLVAPPWYPLRMIFPAGVIGTLEIETEDAWTFLYRFRTRRTLSWSADDKSVKELLQFFIARAGLDFEVLSSSDAATNFKPAFEVRTGTSYRTAIKNLLKMVPDQLVFREGKVLLRNPTTAESIDWIYHTLFGTELLVFRGRYGQTAMDPNRAEVWGDSFMKQAANWPAITQVRDRLSRVTTPTYPDITRAGERANAELRRSEILTSEESWMDAPTNCGLEPWDILQITDLNAGVAAIRRRVLRIRLYWNKKHWHFHQKIHLGAD